MSKGMDSLRRLRTVVLRTLGDAGYRMAQTLIETISATTPKKHAARERRDVRPIAEAIREATTDAILRAQTDGENPSAPAEELPDELRKCANEVPAQITEATRSFIDDPDSSIVDCAGGRIADDGKTVRVQSPCDVVLGLASLIYRAPEDDADLDSHVRMHVKLLGPRVDPEMAFSAIRKLCVVGRDARKQISGLLDNARAAAARVYGLSFRSLKPDALYGMIPGFYSAAGRTFTLTCGTSSGVFNPYEALGTDGFCRVVGVSADCLREGRVKVTVPNRSAAFEGGLLHKHKCERIYVVDKLCTARSMRQVWQCLNTTQQDKFRQMAADNVARTFEAGVQIVLAESFEPWMSRYSLMSERAVLVSHRGRETKKMVHGSYFGNVDNLSEWFSWWSKVFMVASGLSAFTGNLNALAPMIPKAIHTPAVVLWAAIALGAGGGAIGARNAFKARRLLEKYAKIPERIPGKWLNPSTCTPSEVVEELLVMRT